MNTRSEWLTGVRIRRMSAVLTTLASITQNRSFDEITRALWKKCGGPLDEIPTIISILERIRLIDLRPSTPKRTQIGDKLVRSIRAGDSAAIGRYLIRAGFFYDQARLLLELGELDVAGTLHCPLRTAQTMAPQLVHLLQEWEGVTLSPRFRAAPQVVQEINSVWALMPPPPDTPAWLTERKKIGDRAEMYSLQFERTKSNPASIIWVARDTDSLGYDIEDRSRDELRCIEVKGRRDGEIIFFLSENEWNTAQRLGLSYEIHFWGEINLSTEPAIEYSALREAGYPIIFTNPASQIGSRISATAVRWRMEFIPDNSSKTHDSG
jgi:hypothetical protein